MKLLDQELTYPGGPLNFTSQCRVRVYSAKDGRPIMMFTELDNNPGMSVTNAIEYVCQSAYNTILGGVGPEPIWIEHYPPYANQAASFAKVEVHPPVSSSARGADMRSYRARWQHMSGEDIVALTGDLPQD